jgi:integrase
MAVSLASTFKTWVASWNSEDTMALTALQVKNAKPGKYGDGGGLRLDVNGSNKSWVFRYTSPVTGRERFMGLGSATEVTLAQARDSAAAARALVRERKDPIEQRKEQRTTARVEASRAVTFRQYAESFISGRESGWKNPRHRQAWRNSLRDYAFPIIGDKPIVDVDTSAVLQVLRPIWQTKSETARRVRGRIESILSAAKAEGLRLGDANPATWRGHISEVLPGHKKSDVVHFPALPYAAMPAFWRSLTTDASDAARVLRWIILTVCRFSEAKGMEPGEVQGDLWTIPAARMKAGKMHIVPLVKGALAELPFRAVSDVALAKVIRRHTDKPATTHGFRSTFRDWAGDETEHSRETIEAALAHAIGSATEQAYRRKTALTKRRALMMAWAEFANSTVVY